MSTSVFYESLRPAQFTERLDKAPIAYLPLGTLEWHGAHMPLGSDGIQPRRLFELLAGEVGGIVLPMLFLGPDQIKTVDDMELYGMDIFQFEGRAYPEQQLPGSAYWVSDELYRDLLLAIGKQLARAGFKIWVAHGHGPSTNQFIKLADEIKDKYGLICHNCFFDDMAEDRMRLGFQVDHGASNETSIVMAAAPELVALGEIAEPEGVMPLGLAGVDPREMASAENGRQAIEYTKRRMAELLEKDLAELRG